jgi:hypothetical protein
MIEGHAGLCRHVDLVERNPLLVPACSSEKTSSQEKYQHYYTLAGFLFS